MRGYLLMSNRKRYAQTRCNKVSSQHFFARGECSAAKSGCRNPQIKIRVIAIAVSCAICVFTWSTSAIAANVKIWKADAVKKMNDPNGKGVKGTPSYAQCADEKGPAIIYLDDISIALLQYQESQKTLKDTVTLIEDKDENYKLTNDCKKKIQEDSYEILSVIQNEKAHSGKSAEEICVYVEGDIAASFSGELDEAGSSGSGGIGLSRHHFYDYEEKFFKFTDYYTSLALHYGTDPVIDSQSSEDFAHTMLLPGNSGASISAELRLYFRMPRAFHYGFYGMLNQAQAKWKTQVERTVTDNDGNQSTETTEYSGQALPMAVDLGISFSHKPITWTAASDESRPVNRLRAGIDIGWAFRDLWGDVRSNKELRDRTLFRDSWDKLDEVEQQKSNPLDIGSSQVFFHGPEFGGYIWLNDVKLSVIFPYLQSGWNVDKAYKVNGLTDGHGVIRLSLQAPIFRL